MPLNIFEGARRITKLIALIAVLIYAAYAYFSEPYVPISYSIGWPGDKPVLGPCGSDAATEYRSYVPTSNGKRVSLTLCFEKQPATDGRRLVFYECDTTARGNDAAEASADLARLQRALRNADKSGDVQAAKRLALEIRKIQAIAAAKARLGVQESKRQEIKCWGDEWHSDKVRRYTEQTANAFVIPKADEESIESEWWAKWRSDIGESTLALFIGLGIFWAVTWAIGWIVRGFLGIPLGQDHRPKDQSPQTGA